jgi:hypothetical protein
MLLAAAASAGAGLVHAAAAGGHDGDTTLMWLFAATAVAQLGWAAWIVLQPGRVAAVAGLALNGGAALAWLGSRTIGLAGPLEGVEAVGTQDLVAALLGALAAVAAGLGLVRPDAAVGRGRVGTAVVGVACAALLLLAVPAMAAEHTHGSSHDDGHRETTAAAAHDNHDDDGHDGHDNHDDDGHDDHAAAAEGPVISLDDPRLSARQRRDATALITSTRAALTQLPDEAALLAAGYRSIGDGRAVGGFEHFIHAGYLADGRELDPGAIESVVTQRQPDGSKKVMSAMYVLERGKTMADVPDIAGELTVWHDHQNLCWDATGTRLAGVVRNGVCVPGGTVRPTPPMLHVWADDPACGPFTGIEGHGGSSCEHAHAS